MIITHPIKIVKKYLKNYYINNIIGNDLDNPTIKKCTVIIYMSGGINNHYQFIQWINPFKELHKKHPILIVTRSAKLFLKLKQEELFPIVLLRTLNDLTTFYNQYKFPIILYVNHANQNFQSLSYTKGFHIHLNHGESEKESMYSNQSKAYDSIFCVGDRAVERYEEALLNFDPQKYIKIGRPQLDFIEPFHINKTPEQKVILYAPTWEGHHQTMDYSSIEKYGFLLIKELLNNPNYIVLYKPHGSTGLRRNDIKTAHKKIISLVQSHNNGKLVSDYDINSIFTTVDFAFFDNSSVMIDYLHTDKSAFFFDMLEDIGLRYLLKCFNAIKSDDIESVINRMKEHIQDDPNKQARKDIKTFYLGKYTHMESTNKFISNISKFIENREEAL